MGFYRQTFLFIKGLLYDTKSGYQDASKCFVQDDVDIDLTGMVFLITGGNSGIGYETARAIAKRGGIVHLVCRNKEKATIAKETLSKETGNEDVFCHILDVSRIKDVQDFVHSFVKEYGKLDVLVNNAGELCAEKIKTQSENLETNFATNVVGPYALTTGLIPLLQKSKNNPRVVNVGSAGMLLQKLNVNYFEDTRKKFDGITAYAQCKRQMAILTEKWAKDYPEIRFFCMHPGWVDTPAARRGLKEFYDQMKNKFRNAQEGADTVIWLAISNKPLQLKNGGYFQDRKLVDKHLPLARTRETTNDRAKLFKLLSAYNPIS